MAGRRYTDIEKRHICFAFRNHNDEGGVMGYLSNAGVEMRTFSSFYQQYKYMERTGSPIFYEAPADVNFSGHDMFMNITAPQPVQPTDLDLDIDSDIGDDVIDVTPAMCGICFENSPQVVVTTCRHVFCTQCALDHATMARTFARALTCPMCRSEIQGRRAFRCMPYNSTQLDIDDFIHGN